MLLFEITGYKKLPSWQHWQMWPKPKDTSGISLPIKHLPTVVFSVSYKPGAYVKMYGTMFFVIYGMMFPFFL